MRTAIFVGLCVIAEAINPELALKKAVILAAVFIFLFLSDVSEIIQMNLQKGKS